MKSGIYNITTCIFCQYKLKIQHVTNEVKVLDDENINLKLTWNRKGLEKIWLRNQGFYFKTLTRKESRARLCLDLQKFMDLPCVLFWVVARKREKERKPCFWFMKINMYVLFVFLYEISNFNGIMVNNLSSWSNIGMGWMRRVCSKLGIIWFTESVLVPLIAKRKVLNRET